MATVPGIDVSIWEAPVDWPKVRATGQRFAIMKATEGKTWTDPSFHDNWIGAKTAGLLRGAYCYFHPDQDAKGQADCFVSTVKAENDDGELPPILDLEDAGKLAAAKIISQTKIWLDAVEAAFGRKPMIYSGISFLNTSLAVLGGGPPAWAKDYPFWLAWYPYTYTDGMTPSMPRGWFNWTFWQYSESGRLNGINSGVDLDVFNGTLEQLFAFAKVELRPVAPTSHTIVAGDSFETIANKYGVTLRELVNANPQVLKLGDALTVPPVAVVSPDAGPVPIPTHPARTYTVVAGDTLGAIALRFNTTVAAIASANSIANVNLIRVGQVLTIP